MSECQNDDLDMKRNANEEIETEKTAAASTISDEEMNKPAISSVAPNDPFSRKPSTCVREGDFVILAFGDKRETFAHAVRSWKGKLAPLKIGKKKYKTYNLIGLPYGTVLEVTADSLVPLPASEGLIPNHPAGFDSTESAANSSSNNDAEAHDTTFPSVKQQLEDFPHPRDNRDLMDNNTSQSMGQKEITELRASGMAGSTIVEKIILNSATFDKKSKFSKAKYVTRKQIKYQPRCRIVRCTASSVCQTLYLKDPRKLMNMRPDTLAQILNYSNIHAGSQVLIVDTCMGVVTAAAAQRMGGYGKILSVYSSQQPNFYELLQKFNLTFVENQSIKWVTAGDVFGSGEDGTSVGCGKDSSAPATTAVQDDPERAEREEMVWPCPIQDHTRNYLKQMKSDKERLAFMAKRQARFCRKLTRHTAEEAAQWLRERPSDSVIIVARYDPTATLLKVLPYLASSCPFVVYCEFMEPLTQCFRQLQEKSLAINLRLSDTWTREYQVLPGRTHPNMNMSQSGGFLLTGVKLDPKYGHNELSEEKMNEIREKSGRRRRHWSKNKKNGVAAKNGNSEKMKDLSCKKRSNPGSDQEQKRPKLAD